jgi:hypothetical protein
MNLLEELGAIDDFKRKGCTCTHCKGADGNPNATHGSGAPLVTAPDNPAKMLTYRRPSGFAKPLEDTYHLDRWVKRTVAMGVAVSPSLAAQIANLDPKDDKAKLDELAEAAIVAAKGDQAANLGTELHRVVERLNRGEVTIDGVPEMFRADAEAYLEALDRHRLAVVPEMIERKVVNDELRCAGTFDFDLASAVLRADATAARYRGDLKTGQSIDLAQIAYAVQLAIYARGVGYDVATGTRHDLGPVDADTALIVHLPYGSGRCDIVDVDIVKGWQAAELANAARAWNYRKDVFRKREAKNVEPPLVAEAPAAPGHRIAPVGNAPQRPTAADEGGVRWRCMAGLAAGRRTGAPLREDRNMF